MPMRWLCLYPQVDARRRQGRGAEPEKIFVSKLLSKTWQQCLLAQPSQIVHSDKQFVLSMARAGGNVSLLSRAEFVELFQ